MKYLLALALTLLASNAEATMPGWAQKILTKHFNESSSQNVDLMTFDCRTADPANTAPTGKGQLYCQTGAGLRFSISGGAWSTLGTGGGGAVSAVGPACSTGACLIDGVATTGTTLFIWEGSGAPDANEITFIMPSASPGADIDITIPNQTGTLALTTVVPAAYSAVAHTHIMGDCTASDWFNGGACNALIFEGVSADAFEGTLVGAEITVSDKTWTLPNETGSFCTNNASAACLSTGGYGDADGPASSVDNTVPRFDGTGGKTLQTSGVVIDDSNNADFPGTVTASGFVADVLPCSTNSDCNSIKVSFNSGGAGTPTCATQGETNKFSLVPYDDDTLHICSGTTDLGAWNGGDVTAVGSCSTGACFQNDVVTLNTTTLFVIEGPTANGFEHRMLIPVAEPISGQAYDWTYPSITGTLSIEARARTWAPQGLAWNSGGETYSSDTCTCALYTLEGKMLDVDKVGLRVDSDATGAELLDFAVYSLDGATQYVECTVDTAILLTNVTNCTNDIAAPAVMYPGEYWACFAADDEDSVGTLSFDLDASIAADTYSYEHTQTCASGEAPATLTAPTGAMVLENPAAFILADE